MNKQVKRWSAATKRIVVMVLLVLLALIVYRFQDVLAPLVIALLLAFILDPFVDFLTDRVHLSRGLATALVFLVLIGGALGLVAVPLPFLPDISLQDAVYSVQQFVTSLINEAGELLEQPLVIGGYSLELPLGRVYEELSGMLRTFVGSVAQGTVGVVASVASGAFWMIFILMATFYFVKDADRLTEQLDRLAPPGYRDDFVRLRKRITEVWDAFLRGQLLLGLAMAALTALACWVFGLSSPGLLGLLAGLMEFVPSIGPFIAAIPAVLVALFQESTILGLSNFWYAVVIVGLYIALQQIEGNMLVPRILGRSLNLHPLVVLIAIVVGGSLAGILGMLLAAPVLATFRVVGRYVFYRLYDREPFAEAAMEVEPPKPGVFRRVGSAILSWLRKERKRRGRDVEHPDSPGEGEEDA